MAAVVLWGTAPHHYEPGGESDTVEKAHGRAKQFGGHAMAAIVLQSEQAAPTPAPPLLSGTDVQSLLEAVEASAPPAEDETEDDRHVARAGREFLALLDTYKTHYDIKLGMQQISQDSEDLQQGAESS